MNIDNIKNLIAEDKTNEALILINEYISKNPKSDEAFTIRGNIYRKMENWEEALNNYIEAMELNPDSPAKLAYNAVLEVLEFYNHDMYNQ